MLNRSGDAAAVQVEDHPRALPPDPGPSQTDASTPQGEAPDEPPVDPAAISRRLKELPKEVGVMLVSVGVCGAVLPGMAGLPAIVAGGLVLWPKAFGRVEGWLQRRHTGFYHRGVQQIDRYLNDLERRFPDQAKPAPSAEELSGMAFLQPRRGDSQ
jgi:hypothetical protein